VDQPVRRQARIVPALACPTFEPRLIEHRKDTGVLDFRPRKCRFHARHPGSGPLFGFCSVPAGSVICASPPGEPARIGAPRLHTRRRAQAGGGTEVARYPA
jgi:hypothetical protein